MFKKKPLKYSKNLIYITNGFINFNTNYPDVQAVENCLHEIRSNNNTYDSKIYELIYKEYLNNYSLYDMYPFLLRCRLPNTIIGELPLSIPDYLYEKYILIPEELYSKLPLQLMLPDNLENYVPNVFNSTNHHRSKDTRDMLSIDKYIAITRTNYINLVITECYKQDRFEFDMKYLSIAIRKFIQGNEYYLISLSTDDCKIQTRNVIDRITKDFFDKWE